MTKNAPIQRHKQSLIITLAALAGLTLSGAASALQPLITDDTGTQGDGGNQLEFSYNNDRTRVDSETERVHTVPVVYSYGLSETVDLFAGIGYSKIRASQAGDDASGFGNTSLGAKWRFYENEESGTSLAIKPEILLPVSHHREDTGLGTGRTSGNLTFIVSQDVPFGAVHFNVGVGRDRFRHNEDNPDTSYKRASLAPVWEVSEQWKLAMDVGIESARADGATVKTRFVELGAIYSPSKDVDLALGLIRSTDDDSPKATTHSATAGLTWRF